MVHRDGPYTHELHHLRKSSGRLPKVRHGWTVLQRGSCRVRKDIALAAMRSSSNQCDCIMSNYRQTTTSSTYGHASSKVGLTSERIAADIAAFNDAGGRIEVLGNTPFYHRLKETKAPAKANDVLAVPPQSADRK